MEWVREWWAVICGFVAGVFWFARIENILKNLTEDTRESEIDKKNSPLMTVERCRECRAECRASNTIQFGQAEKEFLELKRMIHDIDTAGQRRHAELDSAGQRRHAELITLIMQQVTK